MRRQLGLRLQELRQEVIEFLQKFWLDHIFEQDHRIGNRIKGKNRVPDEKQVALSGREQLKEFSTSMDASRLWLIGQLFWETEVVGDEGGTLSYSVDRHWLKLKSPV